MTADLLAQRRIRRRRPGGSAVQQLDQTALGHPESELGVQNAGDLLQRHAQLGVQSTTSAATFGPKWGAQRYHVVAECHSAENGLPSDNPMTSVVTLEQSGSAKDLARVVEALRAKLGGPHETGLRQAFVDWVRQAAERVAPPSRWVRPLRTLEEFKITLVERAAEWPKQWLQEGIEQGVKRGIEQGSRMNGRSCAGRRRCGSAKGRRRGRRRR